MGSNIRAMDSDLIAIKEYTYIIIRVTISNRCVRKPLNVCTIALP